jgi:hypothetical protein
MLTVKDIAVGFGLDASKLEEHLSVIKENHLRREKEHQLPFNETEIKELLNDTHKHARALRLLLEKMRFEIGSALGFSYRRLKELKLSEEINVSEKNFKRDDFLDDTILRLESIEKATCKSWSLNLNGQKTMAYKDWLVQDLRECWKSLRGKRPKKSSGDNPFDAFMEQACEYMNIDPKGLKRRHLDLP